MLEGDKFFASRDERAMKNWEKRNKEWKKYNTTISKQTGKKEGELLLNRNDEFREKIENQDLMYQAIPLDQKLAGAYWQMSLRGGGIHFVPVGNVFSGLWCPVSLDADETTLETVVKVQSQKMLKSSKQRKRSTYLEKRKKQLARTMNDIQSFSLSNLNDLCIRGENLFSPVVKKPAEIQESKNVIEIQNEIKEIDTPDAKVDIRRLCFEQVTMNTPSYKEIEIKNNGSTVLYYNINISKHSEISSLTDYSHNFRIEKSSGSIIPKNSVKILIIFQSHNTGKYMAKLNISFTPTIQSRIFPITLSALCIDNGSELMKLDALRRNLYSKQAKQQAKRVINTIIENVFSTPMDSKRTPDMCKKLFLQANYFDAYAWLSRKPYSTKPKFENRLYYYPETFNKAQILYKNTVSYFNRNERKNHSQWDLSMETLYNLIKTVKHEKSNELLRSWQELYDVFCTRPESKEVNVDALKALIYREVWWKMPKFENICQKEATEDIEKEYKKKKTKKDVNINNEISSLLYEKFRNTTRQALSNCIQIYENMREKNENLVDFVQSWKNEITEN